MSPEAPETQRSSMDDRNPQTDSAMQLSTLGLIERLREDINMLAELMGGRKIALQAISREAGISRSRILAILSIPNTVNFSMINPLSGEPTDLDDFLPDPDADTAREATENVFNAGLGRILEEVMHS